MFKLTGQTAFITGASRGIGFAAAKALGLQGAKVIINARNPENLQQAKQALEQAGIETIAAPFDISNPHEAVAHLEKILETHKIDIFLGNAASQHRQNLLDYPLEKFEEIIQVNLTSQWAMGRHLARHMVENGHGRIIFTGSITALSGRKDVTAYSIAKAGLHAMVKQWSVELGNAGVTINAIAPGYIATEFTEKLKQDTEFTSWLHQRVPQQKWGNPENVAAAVCFFASREADFITGQTLAIDGGLSSAL